MSAAVLICGKVFDGSSDVLTGPAEILVEQNRIAEIGRSEARAGRWGRVALVTIAVVAVAIAIDVALTTNLSVNPTRWSYPAAAKDSLFPFQFTRQRWSVIQFAQ